MNDQRIPSQRFADDWELIRILGEGSYGTVYLARRTLGSYTEEAAIKHISIPKNEAELNAIREEHGPEESSVLSCLDEIRDQIVGEYQQMRRLQGHTNIVACHDIECCPKQDGPGYDIYIRMELLESVSSRITAGKMNREETIKLGMDICRALMLLSQQEPGIIHRDIKPQNLFVNANGDYKLGDFGTARSIAGTSALMSVKGTYAYMAPEVMNNQPVSFAADIYSLGLVMYRSMNENRAPFVTQGQGGSLAGSEASNMKRLQGVQLPAPAKADRELAGIILKACAFEPRDRWQSAEAMLNALELLTGRTVERHDASSHTTGTVIVNNDEVPKERESRKKNKHPVCSVIVLVACLVLLVAGVYWGIRFLPEVQEWFQRIALHTEADQITTAKMVELQVGEYHIRILNDRTCAVVRYGGESPQVIIPEEISGYTVVSIDQNAIKGNVKLTEITIPPTVGLIGDCAFEGCTALQYVHMPIGLKSIGKYAFSGCNKLAEIDIPEGVETIGAFAFERCDSLTSIYIPDSMQHMGGGVFKACTRLTSVSVAPTSDYYYVLNDVLFNRNGTLVYYPMGFTASDYVIPDGTTMIEAWAFYTCDSLRQVSIPGSVVQINEGAFDDCDRLTSISIPDGTTTIGWQAFAFCDKLTTVVIPRTVTSIGDAAFCGCLSLERIDVSPMNENYFSDGDVLFSHAGELLCYPAASQKVHYSIPDFVTTIGKDAFAYCQLSSIDIPESVQFIREYAFFECPNLFSVVVPDSVREIGYRAFYRCKALASIELGNGITKIGERTFWECESLDSIIIPDGVTTIDDEAFSYCSALKSVVLPQSISEIGSYAFFNCKMLTHIELPIGVTVIKPYSFAYCSSLMDLSFSNNLISIGGHSFAYCTNLTNVFLPDSLLELSDFAFCGCTNIQEITLPASIVHIGKNPFRECTELEVISLPFDHPALTIYSGALIDRLDKRIICCPIGIELDEFVIPQGIETIGASAFFQCTSLLRVVVPDTVVRIEGDAFSRCYALEEINLPNSVQHIDMLAFSSCGALSEIVIPNSVVSIGNYAFSSCKSLKVVHLPDSLTAIGANPFRYCSELTNITISINHPVFAVDNGMLFNRLKKELISVPCAYDSSICSIPIGIEMVGDYAFSGCTRLSSIVVPDSVQLISNHAFDGCNAKLEVTVDSYACKYADINGIPYAIN